MNDGARAGEADTVRVRVTGDYTRLDRQDFTLYVNVPAPPKGGTEDEKDTWCALVDQQINKWLGHRQLERRDRRDGGAGDAR